MVLWDRIDEIMRVGEPVFDGNTGLPRLGADGKQEHQEWRLGDMAIVRLAFSSWPRAYKEDRLFPWVQDSRHGYVEGLRLMPIYKAMSDAEFKEVILDPYTHTQYPEGFQADRWDGKAPVWHALNVLYDVCIATCSCMPWRHTPHKRNDDGEEEGYYSVHYTW